MSSCRVIVAYCCGCSGVQAEKIERRLQRQQQSGVMNKWTNPWLVHVIDAQTIPFNVVVQFSKCKDLVFLCESCNIKYTWQNLPQIADIKLHGKKSRMSKKLHKNKLTDVKKLHGKKIANVKNWKTSHCGTVSAKIVRKAACGLLGWRMGLGTK